MKKLKNSFIWIIIGLVLLIIVFQIVYSNIFGARDTHSYAVLVEGKGMLNKSVLEIDQKEELVMGDEVRTIGEDSIAVIERGDGSITRLGGNTKIIVNETYVSKDVGEIRLSFNLLNGKSWSNVVSFLGEESYFKEYFNDIEAGVRGTVFNVDLDRDYIETMDHDVVLITNSNEYVVSKDTPMVLSSLSIIDLKEFLQNIRDNAWTEVNKQFDADYIGKLQERLTEKIATNKLIIWILEFFSSKYSLLNELEYGKDMKKITEIINGLSGEERQEVYDLVLEKYQAYHALDNQTVTLFKERLLYKKVLIMLASDENKSLLVQSSSYDLKEAMSNKYYELVPDIVGLLDNQKELLKELQINVGELIDFKFLPDDLKEIMLTDLDAFKSLFGDLPEFKSIDFTDALEKVGNLKEGAEGTIHNILNSLKDTIESN